MRNLLDVTNYNNPILVILSLPFTVVAIVLLSLYIPIAFMAMLIGRKPVFDLFSTLSEKFNL